jgi:arylsulfatase
LNIERIKTFDKETLDASIAFIDQSVKDDKPFFVWHNFTRMHAYTQITDDIRGQSGLWQSEYHDAMIEHDQQVGVLLDKLDELGIADNTIVVYSSDNGAMKASWPDGGTSPFRSEKDTNWEGAYRVPAVMRWPGVVKPGSVCNEIVSHHDWLPTLARAAGEPGVVDKLKQGYEAYGKTYKVHIDGYDLTPYLKGDTDAHARPGFFYFSDDGDLVGLRWGNWKLVFMQQEIPGTMYLWMYPLTRLRTPKIFNLRTDPFEVADITSDTYFDFILRHEYLYVPAQRIVGEFLQTFKEFPPRMAAASFTVGEALKKLQSPAGSK